MEEKLVAAASGSCINMIRYLVRFFSKHHFEEIVNA
jgi:hypothetical protein